MSGYHNDSQGGQQQSRNPQTYYQHPQMYHPPQYQPRDGIEPPEGYVQRNRMAAGFLAIFMGSLGMHCFYLGDISTGLTRLLVTLLTFGIGAIIMIILGVRDGLRILDGRTNTDAYGVYLY